MVARSDQGLAPARGADLTIGYLGVMCILVGCMLLVPLAILPFYPYEAYLAPCFLVPAVVVAVVGWLLQLRIAGREKGRLHKGQDAVVIVLTWLLAMFVGSIPFLLSGACDTFTQAVFETMSGLSTTTLTVVDVASCPHVILFYRSVLLFFGGIGLVLIMVSAVSDSRGMRLYSVEGHVDRLLPNMAHSARLIMSIYCSFVGVGTLALMAAGMGPFDALNHAIGAISTGGFSTRAGNVGEFNSVAVEFVMVVLMILGGTNCALHLVILKGHVKAWARDVECRMYFGCIGVGTLVMTTILVCQGTCPTLFDGFRIALFQVVSAVTTTGYQTVPSLAGWPQAAQLLIIVLMVFGSESDSTGGGIKQWRVAVLARMCWWTVRDRVTHRRCVHNDVVERLGRRVSVDAEEREGVLAYALVYLVSIILGTFVFTLCGYSIGDSLFEFTSALGTVGFSAGIATASASPVILWTTIIGMFIGRLEIFPVLIALTRGARLLQGRAK